METTYTPEYILSLVEDALNLYKENKITAEQALSTIRKYVNANT